jgi:flagellar biosynthesis protein
MSQEPPRINITDTEPAPVPRTIPKAVALEYEAGVDSAPRITASGRGVIAEQILAIAFAHGVRVREDAALIEILAAIEVDSVIPAAAFSAVAEILNYVYHANNIYGKPTP